MPSHRSRKRNRGSKDSSTESEESSPESRRSRRSLRKHSRRKRSRQEERMRRRSRTPELPEEQQQAAAELPRAGTSSQRGESQRGEGQPSAPAAPAASPLPSNHFLLDTSFIDLFRELVKSTRTDANIERYPTLNVVSEFDPTKRNQSINVWITKVNECATIYNWTERQIIHYALPKLAGLAQKWYQGLQSLLFTWSEWQQKLRRAFPCDDNYGQLLSEMLACKARFGDNLEEYYYEKMVLINRCNITGKNAIDCLLFGIDDRSVRTSAEAVQFSEPDKLLVYLRNTRTVKRNDKMILNVTLPVSTSASKRSNTVEDNGNRRDMLVKCYNWGKKGHPYTSCKHPIKRCKNCFKVGHLIADCPTKQESESIKTVLNISKEQDNDTK